MSDDYLAACPGLVLRASPCLQGLRPGGSPESQPANGCLQNPHAHGCLLLNPGTVVPLLLTLRLAEERKGGTLTAFGGPLPGGFSQPLLVLLSA